MRFGGGEPPSFDEDLRQAQGRFLVPDTIRPPGIDFPRGDGGFGPVIYKPIQEYFDRGKALVRLSDRLFDRRRSSLIQSFK